MIYIRAMLKMDGWVSCPRICADCGRVVLLGYAPQWRYVHSGGLAVAGWWECWHELCWRKAFMGPVDNPPHPVLGVPRRDQIFAWDFGPSLGGG